MRRGQLVKLDAVGCTLARTGFLEKLRHVREHPRRKIFIPRALVLHKDDGLVLPAERQVVLHAVEQDIVERRDREVFRHDDVRHAHHLVQLRELYGIVEDHAEDRVLVLMIRHTHRLPAPAFMIAQNAQKEKAF